MRTVEILGVGCPNCKRAEAEVRKVLEEKGWQEGRDYEMLKVTAPGDIAARGVMQTPGVAVDGKIVSFGRIPKRDQIESWFI